MELKREAPLHMFLDTQVFRALSFNWKHPDLGSLKKRVQKGSIKVLITPILLRESVQQMHGMLNELNQALRKTEQKAVFLNGISSQQSEILSKLKGSIPSIEEIEKSNLDFFLTELDSTLLGYPKHSSALFDLYFRGQPPFGTKGKKSEFPDAANLLILAEFSKKTETQIVVVSDDDDWERVAQDRSTIKHVRTLAEALSLGIRLEWTSDELWSDQELFRLLSRKIGDFKNLIIQSLKFDSTVNMGDGHLEHLNVWSITPHSLYTTDITHKGEKILCRGEFSYGVSFSADMTLGDAELNNELEQSVSGEDELTATIDFEFPAERPNEIKVTAASHLDGLALELFMDAI